ncbi:hypothetical protein EON81_02965 [bacterium]|nr:MAG: hypothetical protein EON81_02965 [bacterium]
MQITSITPNNGWVAIISANDVETVVRFPLWAAYTTRGMGSMDNVHIHGWDAQSQEFVHELPGFVRYEQESELPDPNYVKPTTKAEREAAKSSGQIIY